MEMELREEKGKERRRRKNYKQEDKMRSTQTINKNY